MTVIVLEETAWLDTLLIVVVVGMILLLIWFLLARIHKRRLKK